MSTVLPLSEDDLLTVGDVGEHLHASRATVFRLLKTQQLKSIKVGKSRLVRRGALHDFVRAQEAASARVSA
ncbi:MAG: helix-turn-helix domain-containing protein [Gordonia amarae]